MKSFSLVSLLCLICSVSLFSQEDNCARITNFGVAQICLPAMEEYEECYFDPRVKYVADATEVPSNSVLGYYLNEETYQRRDSLGAFSFDDYWKIYVTDALQDFETDKKTLREFGDYIGSNFNSMDWELIEEEIEAIDLGVEVGVPIVLDSYNLTEESFTYLMVAEYQVEEEGSFTMALALNGMVIESRLVCMAYYLSYKDLDTMLQLKENSNKILMEILRNNK